MIDQILLKAQNKEVALCLTNSYPAMDKILSYQAADPSSKQY